jgi:hypothetical protein
MKLRNTAKNGKNTQVNLGVNMQISANKMTADAWIKIFMGPQTKLDRALGNSSPITHIENIQRRLELVWFFCSMINNRSNHLLSSRCSGHHEFFWRFVRHNTHFPTMNRKEAGIREAKARGNNCPAQPS